MSSPLSTYDLHLHTWWSFDGLLPPQRLFQAARERGVHYLAITEHHQLDSWPEIEQIHRHYPEVHLIRAAEISARTSIGNVDFLCYNLPAPDHPKLAALTQRYHEWQRSNGTALRNGLNRLGIPFSIEEHRQQLASYRPESAIDLHGITHLKGIVLKSFLIERGHAANEEEATLLLQQARETEPPPHYPSVADLIDTVHSVGGLVVIAHPQRYFNNNDLKRMDQLREECQLDGIECAHPRGVAPELTPFYREYCIRHQLLSTAGSDTHDETQLAAEFGRHGGPQTWLEELLERVQPISAA